MGKPIKQKVFLLHIIDRITNPRNHLNIRRLEAQWRQNTKIEVQL